MGAHRSSAYFPILLNQGRGKADQLSTQARFVIRMALACHEAGTAYDVKWEPQGSRFKATLTATGAIPMPKPFPKPARENREYWKPSPFESSYQLNGCVDPKTGNWQSGFVIEHSSGLCLFKAGTSETGELAAEQGLDILDGWWLLHNGSRKGFGLSLKFSRAVSALLFAAPLCEWSKSVDELNGTPDFLYAGHRTIAEFGKGYEAEAARRKADQYESQRTVKPQVTEPAAKPIAKLRMQTSAAKPQVIPVTDRFGRTRYVTLPGAERSEAKRHEQSQPAAMPVQLPNGRTVYIPDPVTTWKGATA
jgi:hypothetical protein